MKYKKEEILKEFKKHGVIATEGNFISFNNSNYWIDFEGSYFAYVDLKDGGTIRSYNIKSIEFKKDYFIINQKEKGNKPVAMFYYILKNIEHIR